MHQNEINSTILLKSSYPTHRFKTNYSTFLRFYHKFSPIEQTNKHRWFQIHFRPFQILNFRIDPWWTRSGRIVANIHSLRARYADTKRIPCSNISGVSSAFQSGGLYLCAASGKGLLSVSARGTREKIDSPLDRERENAFSFRVLTFEWSQRDKK